MQNVDKETLRYEAYAAITRVSVIAAIATAAIGGVALSIVGTSLESVTESIVYLAPGLTLTIIAMVANLLAAAELRQRRREIWQTQTREP